MPSSPADVDTSRRQPGWRKASMAARCSLEVMPPPPPPLPAPRRLPWPMKRYTCTADMAEAVGAASARSATCGGAGGLVRLRCRGPRRLGSPSGRSRHSRSTGRLQPPPRRQWAVPFNQQGPACLHKLKVWGVGDEAGQRAHGLPRAAEDDAVEGVGAAVLQQEVPQGLKLGVPRQQAGAGAAQAARWGRVEALCDVAQCTCSMHIVLCVVQQAGCDSIPARKPAAQRRLLHMPERIRQRPLGTARLRRRSWPAHLQAPVSTSAASTSWARRCNRAVDRGMPPPRRIASTSCRQAQRRARARGSSAAAAPGNQAVLLWWWWWWWWWWE